MPEPVALALDVPEPVGVRVSLVVAVEECEPVVEEVGVRLRVCVTEPEPTPDAVLVGDGVVVGLELSDCVDDFVWLTVGACVALPVGLGVRFADAVTLPDDVCALVGDVVREPLVAGLAVGVNEGVAGCVNDTVAAADGVGELDIV